VIGMLCSGPCPCVALDLLEEPSYGAAPRDHFGVRVVKRVAALWQAGGREALGACAEGEEPRAARVRVVQREAGQHGVFSRLWGEGQRGVLREGGVHDVVDRDRGRGRRAV
jgi:hypothetical protein